MYNPYIVLMYTITYIIASKSENHFTYKIIFGIIINMKLMIVIIMTATIYSCSELRDLEPNRRATATLKLLRTQKFDLHRKKIFFLWITCFCLRYFCFLKLFLFYLSTYFKIRLICSSLFITFFHFYYTMFFSGKKYPKIIPIFLV